MEGRSWRILVTPLIIWLVLMVHLYVLGYPIIMVDSLKYSKVAIMHKADLSAMMTLTVAISPLVWIIGAWGFPIVSMSLLTYVLCSALEHLRKNALVGSLAVFLSASGFVSSAVMMDIYTCIGLLAIYLVLSGKGEPVLYFIIGACYIAHVGNLLLFPLVCIFYFLAFGKVNRKALRPLIAAFFIPLLITAGYSQMSGGGLQALTNSSNARFAEHMILRTPSITREYIKSHPGSKLAEHSAKYEDVIFHEAKLGRVALHWNPPFRHVLIPLYGGYYGFDPEAKDLISYALREHPMILAHSFAERTLRFLTSPDFHHALVRSPVNIQGVFVYYPGQRATFEGSLQKQGMLSSIDLWIFRPTYYLSVLAALLVALIQGLRRGTFDQAIHGLAVFCIIVLILNAIIMTVPGGFGRYQVRVLLLPTLLLFALIWDIAKTSLMRVIALKGD